MLKKNNNNTEREKYHPWLDRKIWSLISFILFQKKNTTPLYLSLRRFSLIFGIFFASLSFFLSTLLHTKTAKLKTSTPTTTTHSIGTMGISNDDQIAISWPFNSDFMHTQIQNCAQISLGNSFPMESICEDTVVADKKQSLLNDFNPVLRSGEWSDIGHRTYMEDTHVCIADLAKKFGSNLFCEEAVSFYGVFDGHGGEGAAHFVRDHLPRVIVEDSDFPLEMEKVVARSFMETDVAFANSCSLESTLSSGTTALTAMIFGRSLLVANAGDCRAVLSRHGVAIEMSNDHRPCCENERTRVESLGGFIDDGYLNGQLAVTRALGDWHIKGLKELGKRVGPLSAEPELKLWTLTKDDEFLIIGSDGIWDVFRSQNAVDFIRRRLQEHNDVKLCCKEVVEEAMKRGAIDNLTVVIVCFHLDPPPQVVVPRMRVRRSISAEGLQNLKCLLEG